MLFQMLTTMHGWLSADEKNVVVVHCVVRAFRLRVSVLKLIEF